MGTTCLTTGRSNRCVLAADRSRARGHLFYELLNRILEAAGFDTFVDGLCARFYTTMGQPSLAPGCYFRFVADDLEDTVSVFGRASSGGLELRNPGRAT